MSQRIVVVGAGVSGLAAAWALRKKGVIPTVFCEGVGASSMSSGAADSSPWTAQVQAEPSADVRAFLQELGAFREGGHVATTEGVARPAAAVGARVLRLDAHAGRVVRVVNWMRSDFSPRSLVNQLGDSKWAKETGTRFELVDVPGVVEAGELAFPTAAFVRLFDAEDRLVRLVEAAKACLGPGEALLLGPWLGSGRTPVDPEGRALGETLSPPDGAFGGRWDASVSDWCARVDLPIRTERVQKIAVEEGQVRLEVQSGTDSRPSTVWADAVIVATGGLIGRGVGLIEEPGWPSRLDVVLDPTPPLSGGAREGWDGAKDGGAWISPPHFGPPASGGTFEQIAFAGDVRRRATPTAPGGTFLGAAQSGLDAAVRILEGG